MSELQQIDLFRDGMVLDFRSYVELASKKEDRLRPLGLSDLKKSNVRSPRVVSDDAKAKRLDLAKQVLAEGGSISEFARRANINTSWATTWLRENHDDLHKQFLDQVHPNTLPPQARIARLMAVKIGQEMGLSISRIARELNMHRTPLLNWLSVWAPDGIDDALEMEIEALELVA